MFSDGEGIQVCALQRQHQAAGSFGVILRSEGLAVHGNPGEPFEGPLVICAVSDGVDRVLFFAQDMLDTLRGFNSVSAYCIRDGHRDRARRI